MAARAARVTMRTARGFGIAAPLSASHVAAMRNDTRFFLALAIATAFPLAADPPPQATSAKRTPELIPLCHAIALTRVAVELTVEPEGVAIEAVAEARDRTGVEMEAMTAAAVAALKLYDMLKGIDRGMVVEHVRLDEKSGGRSGHWTREGG